MQSIYDLFSTIIPYKKLTCHFAFLSRLFNVKPCSIHQSQSAILQFMQRENATSFFVIQCTHKRKPKLCLNFDKFRRKLWITKKLCLQRWYNNCTKQVVFFNTKTLYANSYFRSTKTVSICRQHDTHNLPDNPLATQPHDPSKGIRSMEKSRRVTPIKQKLLQKS